MMKQRLISPMALRFCLGVSEMGMFGEKKRNGFKSRTT